MKMKDDELNRLDLFLRSPYLNTSKKVLLLFRELRKYHPLFTHLKLTRENIMYKVKPQRKYNDSTYRNLMSDLLIQINHFLEMENYRKDKVKRNLNLLEALLIRSEPKLFNQKKAETDVLMKKAGIDSVYFQNAYEEDIIILNEKLLNKNKNKKEIESIGDGFIKALTDLTNFYIMETAALYFNYKIQLSDYIPKKKSYVPEKLIKSLNAEKLIEVLEGINEYKDVMRLYSLLLKAFLNLNNEDIYFEYKNEVLKMLSKLGKSERSFHLSKLEFYCGLKNRGRYNEVFEKELFDIYQIMISSKSIQHSTGYHIPGSAYRMIVQQGTKLREFDKTQKFIDEYTNKINPKRRDNLHELAKAMIYTEKGIYDGKRENLDKALKHIENVNCEDYMIKFDLKDMLIKIYYETGDSIGTASIIKQYRDLLRTNEKVMTPEKIQNRKKFLVYVSKLIKFRDGNGKAKPDKLYNDLLKDSNVQHMGWLREKIRAAEAAKRSEKEVLKSS
jgi:hypothetical protein